MVRPNRKDKYGIKFEVLWYKYFLKKRFTITEEATRTMSGSGFNFGGPAKSSAGSANYQAPTPSSTGSRNVSYVTNSYTGSFIDSDVKPEDSVSNTGVTIFQSMANLQLQGGGQTGGAGGYGGFGGSVGGGYGGSAGGSSGGSAGGGSGSGASTGTINQPQFIFSDYHNSPLAVSRHGFDCFASLAKTPLTYAAGPLLKLHHSSNDLREFKSAMHMQYLHVVDTQMSGLVTVHAKDVMIGNVNNFIFHTSVTVSTNWGKCDIFLNFKNYIVKPVVQSLYSGTLPEAFFKASRTGAVEPLSKAIFEDWLAR